MLENPTTVNDDPAERSFFGRVFGYFLSRAFWFTVLGLIIASVVLFFALNAGLSWYTNHGQRLEVSNYEGMSIPAARQQIEQADFRVELIDSVFLVDQPPGIVLRQDPKPGAFVKENRRIYLTVTKRIPDEVTLPPLTGTYDFDRYRRKLNMLDLEGRVVERSFNSQYQPNTILKVYYEEKEISEARLKEGFSVPKGSELTFLVTSREGGMAVVPDLACLTVDQARLIFDNRRLRVGRIRADEGVSDPEIAFVYRQDPPAGNQLPFEEEVHLYVSATLPDDCGGL